METSVYQPPADAADTDRGITPSPARQLADGVELIGEYADSGFVDPHFLVRRSDGQVLQISKLLYLTAEAIDSACNDEQVATKVSKSYGRDVTADNIAFLADNKLKPLGLLKGADGSAPSVSRIDPMLALKFRFQLIPPRAVRALTALLKPLFFRPVILVAMAGLIALDVWLFLVHGVAQSLRTSLYEPQMLLLVLGLVIASAVFHELGHATACRSSGADPGGIGAGIYLAWPAFYTDVTDAYRLGRTGRLRTDLGGIYFNVIFSLGTAGAYALTGNESLLLVIVVQHLEMVHQLIPVVRLDGYYILSDLVGVPDLFSRIRPILRSLLPFKKPDPRVTELKRWVRFAVGAWVLIVIPLLALNIVMLLSQFPRILSTAWDSASQRSDVFVGSVDRGDALSAVASVVQILAVSLPIVGISLSFGRMGQRAVQKAWQGTQDRPVSRVALVSGVLAGGLLLGTSWLSPRSHEPIGPHSRGTLGEGVRSFVGTVSLGRVTGQVEPADADPSHPLQTSQPSPGMSQSPDPSGPALTQVEPSPSSPAAEPTASPSPTDPISPTPSPTTPSPSPTSSSGP